MSVGQQLIRAIIDSQSRSAMRELDACLFSQEEQPLYDFVVNFYRHHGTLPSDEALQENGFRLPNASDPISYYLERARTRAIGQIIIREHPLLVRAIGRNDMVEAVSTVDRMRSGAGAFVSNQDTVCLGDVAELVREDYLEALGNPAMRGIPSGWRFLDERTSGFANGDIWAIVARPGVGKTYVMLNMALAAWRAGKSVLFVTMEMTNVQVARRFVAMHAGLNPNSVSRGRLDMWGERIFYEGIANLQEGPPFHFTSGSLRMPVGHVDTLIQEFNPDIVYIDAAYLLEPDNHNSSSSRHEMLQDVLRGIKSTALARNRPIVISVQFNREGKKSGGLETIGGTDWIGQVASGVLSLTEGPRGFEKTMRRCKIIKLRDDVAGEEFVINYRFQPFDMSFAYEMLPDGSRAGNGPSTLNNLVTDMGRASL